MYRFRRENKCDKNGCCSVRCNSLFLCERKDKQREIREIREIREDALLKKGLAENFQPLRGLFRALKTVCEYSNNQN